VIARRAADRPEEPQKPVAADVAAPAIQKAEVPKPARSIKQSPTPPAKPAPHTDVSESEIVRRTKPSVPPDIMNTIRGTVAVKVKVFVDPAGNVAYANLVSEGPSKYFAARALETGRQWKFKAPSVEGRSVSSIWMLRFAFRQNGIRIVPSRI